MATSPLDKIYEVTSKYDVMLMVMTPTVKAWSARATRYR